MHAAACRVWRCSRAVWPSGRRALCKAAETPTHRLRNVGIMAHIDAGKTTTTERMLLYSGRLQEAGNVDDGDTITDYMEQERERGITIQSAAVSFAWEGHQINLIDTPGHIDFTMEVERALRVLDGAVAVFDGVAGVQPQSKKVWRRANKYRLPRIAYINKMDRVGANFKRAVESINSQLGACAVPISFPLGGGGHAPLRGHVDLVRMSVVEYTDEEGFEMTVTPLGDAHPLRDVAAAERLALVEAVANVDDALADLYLSGGGEQDAVPPSELIAALRRATLSCGVVPVVCGSSLQYRGVQSVLDSIVHFLPSPLDCSPVEASLVPVEQRERRSRKVRRERAAAADPEQKTTLVHPSSTPNLAALAFKVLHHPHLGMLVFVRVYSGELTARAEVFNATQKQSERPLKLLRVFADEHDVVASLRAGDVGAISGLKHTRTGDTLTSAQAQWRLNNPDHPHPTDGKAPAVAKDHHLLLEGVEALEPVVSCAVETDSATQQKALYVALEQLMREDPSLQFNESSESGQMLLRGLGELHLDIVMERLRREFKLDVVPGKMTVTYRETVTGSFTHSLSHTPPALGKTPPGTAGVTLVVSPIDQGEGASGEGNVFEVDGELEWALLRDAKAGGGKKFVHPLENTRLEGQELLDQVQAGVEDALDSGPRLGFPVINCRVVLLAITATPDSTLLAFRRAAAVAVSHCLRNAGPCLMEPVVDMEVVTEGKYVGVVLSDLAAQRRAHVRSVKPVGEGDEAGANAIACEVPLSATVGYATVLRSLTRGDGTFSMNVAGFRLMPPQEEQAVVNEALGAS